MGQLNSFLLKITISLFKVLLVAAFVLYSAFYYIGRSDGLGFLIFLIEMIAVYVAVTWLARWVKHTWKRSSEE